jgi:hypothetical protein
MKEVLVLIGKVGWVAEPSGFGEKREIFASTVNKIWIFQLSSL